MKVNFLDVGQGDSTLIQFANGTTMLIDCNFSEDFFTRLDPLLPVDEEENRHLDYLVITHPHHDHIKGIEELGKRYKIHNIWESGHRLYIPREKQNENKDYYAMLSLIQKVKKNGGLHEKLTAYSRLALPNEDVSIVILSPTRAYLEDERPTERDIHDQCLVLRVEYAGRSILFTGDSSMESWRDRIVEYYSDKSGRPNILPSTVLHASHHGSYTFFKPQGNRESEPYIEAIEKISPDVTIISVGKDNRHGHPDEGSLEIYTEHTFNNQVFMTQDHGTIHLHIDENGDYRVRTENMLESIRTPRIGSIKIEVEPLPMDNGVYEKNVRLTFRAKFTKQPQDLRNERYKWIVHNNGIGKTNDSRYHDWYIGNKESAKTYENITKYEGTHLLLCEVRNQRNHIIATNVLTIRVK